MLKIVPAMAVLWNALFNSGISLAADDFEYLAQSAPIIQIDIQDVQAGLTLSVVDTVQKTNNASTSVSKAYQSQDSTSKRNEISITSVGTEDAKSSLGTTMSESFTGNFPEMSSSQVSVGESTASTHQSSSEYKWALSQSNAYSTLSDNITKNTKNISNEELTSESYTKRLSDRAGFVKVKVAFLNYSTEPVLLQNIMFNISALADDREDEIVQGQWLANGVASTGAVGVGESFGGPAQAMTIDIPAASNTPGYAQRTIFLQGLNTAALLSLLSENAKFLFNIQQYDVKWRGETASWSALVGRWRDDARRSATVLVKGYSDEGDPVDQLFLVKPQHQATLANFLEKQHVRAKSAYWRVEPCPTTAKSPRDSIDCKEMVHPASQKDADRKDMHFFHDRLLESVNFRANWQGGWFATELPVAEVEQNGISKYTLDAGKKFMLKFLGMKEITDNILIKESYSRNVIIGGELLADKMTFSPDLAPDSVKVNVPQQYAFCFGGNNAPKSWPEFPLSTSTRIHTRWKSWHFGGEGATVDGLADFRQWYAAHYRDLTYINGPQASPGFVPNPNFVTLPMIYAFNMARVSSTNQVSAVDNKDPSNVVLKLTVNAKPWAWLGFSPETEPSNSGVIPAINLNDGVLQTTISPQRTFAAVGYDLNTIDLCVNAYPARLSYETGRWIDTKLPTNDWYNTIVSQWVNQYPKQKRLYSLPSWLTFEVVITHTLSDYITKYRYIEKIKGSDGTSVYCSDQFIGPDRVCSLYNLKY